MNTEALNMSVSIKTITPEDAKRFLQTSERNRTINERRVKKYAEDMRNGRWSPATMLIVDEDGCMVDAHHRAMAIIEANVPVQMCVFTGLPKKFIPYIDTGRPRSAGDMLAFIEGLDGVSSLRNKSAAVKLVLQIRKGDMYAMPGYDDMAEFMLQNKDLLEIAYEDYLSIKPLGATVGVAAACFLIYEANGAKQTRIKEFLMQVATGEMLKAGMPAYALRNAIFANGKTTSGIRRRLDTYFVLRAWKAFARNEAMQLLRRPKLVEAAELVAAKC